ncbi:hypothetical protein IWZ00DRAFT_72120 [Phyllosticta capitalensis]
MLPVHNLILHIPDTVTYKSKIVSATTMSSSTTHDSPPDARSESNSSSEGLAIPTPGSETGKTLIDGFEMFIDSQIHERVQPLEASLAAEALKTKRFEEMVEKLGKEVASLRKENAEHQAQNDVLRNEVKRLARDVMDQETDDGLRQKQIQGLQGDVNDISRQVFDITERQDRMDDVMEQYRQPKGPEGVQQKAPNVDSTQQADQDKVPQTSWREEQITELQQSLDDHKEMMAHLVETNEDLLFDPKKIGFFGYKQSYNGDPVSGPDTIMHGSLVERFIEALQVATQTVPERVVRRNLQYCFVGDARTWYFSVLTQEERGKLAKGLGFTNWTTQLRKKWGRDDGSTATFPSFQLGLQLPRSARLRSTMDFFVSAMEVARQLGKDDTYSQLALAYEHTGTTLRHFVAPPKMGETLNDFIIRADSVLREKGYLI